MMRGLNSDALNKSWLEEHGTLRRPSAPMQSDTV
jgi:hypothetical protein